MLRLSSYFSNFASVYVPGIPIHFTAVIHSPCLTVPFDSFDFTAFHFASQYLLVFPISSLSSTSLHFKSSQSSSHVISLHSTAQHLTSLHFILLHCTSLYCTSLHSTALHFASRHTTHFNSLQITSLYCTALHCTSLQFSSLHLPSLHSIVWSCDSFAYTLCRWNSLHFLAQARSCITFSLYFVSQISLITVVYFDQSLLRHTWTCKKQNPSTNSNP